MNRKTIQFLSIGLFVALLVWGGYVLLYWLGVPVHGAVLLDESGKEFVNQSCQTQSLICRGFYSFIPAISHTIGRASPFLWYAVISFVLYLLFVGWHGLSRGRFYLRLHFTPWKVLLLFLGVMWLLFTSLSFMKSGDNSIRRVVEPLPNVYQNIGPEALQELQANFKDLQEQKCLHPVGQFSNGAGVFNLKTRCVQQSFVTRVLSEVLFNLLLLFELLIAGGLLLRYVLRLTPSRLLTEALISVALGAGAWIALLWSLAVVGIITSTAGWILAVAIPIIGYKQVIYWGRQFIEARWNVDIDWYNPMILVAWLLLSYLALNYLNVIRPFPIGWDDLGSYLNRPKLMVSYGHFVFSMPSFGWEYLSSLGFLLFGYDSTFASTTSQLINWSAGLLAVLSVYTFTNVFLGRGRGVLAALIYYALPLVGHFSFADMKIDNAVFTMGALAMFAISIALFRPEDEHSSELRLRWILLSGIFAGFAFSFKATGVMVLMALGAVMLGVLLHWTAFVGTLFFTIIVFVQNGALHLNNVTERLFGGQIESGFFGFLVACFLIGLGLLAFAAFKRRNQLKTTIISVLVFALGFFVVVTPWMEHNNIQVGNIIPKIALGAPNRMSPIIDLRGTAEKEYEGQVIHSLPAEIALDMENEYCEPTGHKEELDRYWGFREGWEHYLTLPWRIVNNIDSAGYYVTTTPLLLLFPLLLLLPFFWRNKGRWLRWLFLGTLFILLEWMFTANGIPWYGIGVFLGLAVGLEALVTKAPDLPNRVLAGILITVGLFFMFGFRFWQFEQQRNIFEYSFGKVSDRALQERTIPYYDDIRDSVVERNTGVPDRPYLYRVGTFIPYFIPKNLEIIATTDHQLDTFNCIHQERDPVLTTQRLKALGFNSLVFDTNTATIEKNPNGSLHQKVNMFVNYLNNPDSGLQTVINDPGAGVAYILIP